MIRFDFQSFSALTALPYLDYCICKDQEKESETNISEAVTSDSYLLYLSGQLSVFIYTGYMSRGAAAGSE